MHDRFQQKKSKPNAEQSGGKAPGGQTPPKRPTRLWPAPCLRSKYYSCANCQHNSKCNEQEPERIFWRISVSKAGVYINAVTLFVLIIYTFATIMLVKFGADGIKTQMDVANTSGAQAMDALKAQQRPWIRIVEADVPDTNVDESSRIPYIFPAKVENVGNMPAVDVVPLGYSVVPISSHWEKRKLPPVLYRNAQKICAKGMRRTLFDKREERMTIFPANGDRVPALSIPFRDIETTIDNFIDGSVSIDSMLKHGTNEAAIIFFAGYRSSIDDEIHCTAEAFFVRSTKDVLFTGQDILGENRFCYSHRSDIEIDPHPIGIGYAD